MPERLKRQMTRRKSGVDLLMKDPLQRKGSIPLMSLDTAEDDKVDLLELKRRVEDDLHRDEQKLLYLTQNVARAAFLEESMARTLEVFDQRLSSLEAVIHPIHQQTLKLVGAQENLETVGDLLEEAVKQQGVSFKTGRIIRGGITEENLDEYLAAIWEVRSALAYFTDNAPGNPEMQTLFELHARAMATVQSQVKTLLVEDVESPSREEILETRPELAIDAEKIFKTDGAALLKLTGLLLQSDNSTELTRMFAAARGDTITATVDGKQGMARNSSDGSTGTKGIRRGLSLRRRSNSNMNPQAATPQKTPVKASFRQSTSGHKRVPSDQQKVHAGMDVHAEVDDPMATTYEKGSHPFLRLCSVTFVCLVREHTLATRLVETKPEILHQLLRQLYHTKMDSTISMGELLVGNMSRRSVRGATGLSLLDILQTLLVVRRDDLELVLGICNEQTGVRFHQLVASLVKLGHRALFEFQDYIQSDDLKKLPPDGTVHELTSTTLAFITSLQAYDDIGGFVLGTEGECGSGSDVIDVNVVDNRVGRLVNWVIKVLDVLCNNVSRKARQFEQPALRCTFLINNYDYIFKYIVASPYAEVFREQEPQIDSRYIALIEEQFTAYKRHTWDSIISYTRIDEGLGGPNMSKKEREAIKERYSKFNDGFDSIVEAQTRYTVPSSEVRERIISDIIDYVVPHYKRFDDRFRNSGFTQKNPHKYLKYTVGDVEEKIRRLFSAT